MTRTVRQTFDLAALTACLTLGALACDDPGAADEARVDAPSFSPSGKHDGAEQAIRYIQGVGTQAEVQGRFQPDLKWRGFTFEAQAGQQIQVALSAQLEQNGLLLEQRVDTQVLLYGPADSEDALFEQVIADSGLAQQAKLDVELEKDGFYLLAATRDDAVQQAQFDLEIECPNCGADDSQTGGDDRLCQAGRMFVEGAILKSQVWDRCEVIVLEPTRLPAEEKLTIGPDVHVRAHYYITDFHPEGWGEVRLTLEGELDMQSTPDHRIIFESNVEGKQWDGISIVRPGTVMHDFVFQDTHEGLRIEPTAEATRVVNGEIMLNRFGLRLRSAGIELEGLKIHDNQFGIENGVDRRTVHALDSLFLLDSELFLNDTAIRLTNLTGSFIDGLSVHDNGAGISIANDPGETAEPENWVSIANSRVFDNGSGILLRGNGAIDHCEFLRNATYGVQTVTGWQKVKNSVFESNSHACETPERLDAYRPEWFVSCAAAVATADAHTVFRNNIIEKNDGYGVAILGDPTVQRRAVGRDPAVLNSLVRANSRAGIVAVDAPLFSVEFNTIKDNSEGAVHLAYSSFGGALFQQRHNRETMRQEIVSAFARPNRVQRNNIETDEIAFHRLIYRRVNSDDEEVPASFPSVQLAGQGFASAYTLSNNFLPAADVADMQALDDLTGFDVMPLLDGPEATAGLIREIEPFDE